jgi:hypothetical protein
MATTAPVGTSTAAAPSAAVTALNTARAAAVASGQSAYAGNDANLSTFSTANPSLSTVGGTGGGSTGTVPTQVPTKAPAVMSATPAVNKINNTLVPAMNQGSVDIASQNAKNPVDPNYQMSAAELADPSLYTQRIAAYNASKAGANAPTPPAPVSPGDQAMKDAANTPDPGYQFAYDASGNKQQIAQGSPIPPGLSTTPPADPTLNGHTVVQSTTTAQGTTFQQYSDGTYGIADQSGAFAGAATAQDFQNAQANSPATVMQNIQASLSSLSAGSIPLSDSQQAQVNALQTSLAQNIATLTQTNASFTGANEVAENLYGMGNSLSGIGIIQGTINQGVQAIAKLQSDTAGAIAKMTDDFQQENYTDMLGAYNASLSATKDIQDHLDQMQTFAETQKQNALTEVHQQFQDQMSSQNLSLAQKKQTFDQYMQQATLDEKTKADASDAYYKQQDLDLKEAAATNGFNTDGSGAGPVAVTATGAPNKAAQAAFLAQYPANVQTQITGLANYTLLPSSFPTRANKGDIDRATAVALAQQYDPSYNENLAATRQKVYTTYNDGTSAPSKSITALNTAAAHLSTLTADSAKLGNVGFTPINDVKNFLGNLTGVGPQQTGTKTDIAAVTGELAAAFKSSGATDAEIKSLGTIDSNSSPAAVKSYVEAATSLMGGKLQELNDSYTAAMGEPPSTSFLHPTAANTLLQLQTQGYNIDIPALQQTAPVQLKNFVAADPTANTAVYNNAKAALMKVNGGQQPSADDIYQLLQTNGYVQ